MAKQIMFPAYLSWTFSNESVALQFWSLMAAWGHVVPSLLPHAASLMLINSPLAQLILKDNIYTYALGFYLEYKDEASALLTDNYLRQSAIISAS